MFKLFPQIDNKSIQCPIKVSQNSGIRQFRTKAFNLGLHEETFQTF